MPPEIPSIGGSYLLPLQSKSPPNLMSVIVGSTRSWLAGAGRSALPISTGNRAVAARPGGCLSEIAQET